MPEAFVQGTFFEHSRLSLRTIILLIYKWSTKATVGCTARELKVSEKTVIDWYRFCREITIYYFQTYEPNHQIGGYGKIGTFFEHSRLSLRTIILLIYKWSTKATVGCTARELNVSEKTVIDWYRFCREITIYYFQTHEPNHQIGDPNVHTQNIENSWKNVKRMLKMKGTNTRKHLEEYLYEFMYRKKFVSTFSFMVRHIAAKYQLNQ
ncbi:hypothetical protein O9G_003242 [Rozella allomycis CSF55]|uniref:ISXO2-like transposase domain-containing protein n=1 Tax=Rozella allomycis (strain CSF55) TaxID=988480 RepID=A0A075ASW3_ROZAC|nr:hypothetical protein O9G_003242 [Rozella allomycis CSF55]|eukprot:EPZ33381.1 hypothetical protein O9G_003242 [Rozella allomycis CSF55]